MGTLSAPENLSSWLETASLLTSDLVCVLDQRGEVVFMNPAAQHVLLSPETQEAYWKSDDGALLSHDTVLARARATGNWHGFLCVEGTGCPLLYGVRVTPLADQDGQVGHYHLQGSDIARLDTPYTIHLDEPRFEMIIERIDDIISLHDENLFTLYATPSLSRITGLPRRQYQGRSAMRHIHPEDHRRLLYAFRRLRQKGEATVRLRHRIKGGEWRWFETRARLIVDERMAPARYLCTTRDVSDQIQVEQQMLWQARHDILTALPNRAYFLERIQQAIESLPPDRLLGVLFIDLDGFKRINDSLGHATGDSLLRIVAQRLLDSARSNDLVGRIGGDEFTLLLTPLSSRDEGEALVRRLLAAVTRPILIGGQDLFVGASIGVALYPDDGSDAEALVSHADVAMYQAKKSGNDMRFFNPSMYDAVHERLRQERLLRRALEQGEFQMYYQPQTCPRTGKILGLEALLRWQRPPDEAPITPARFISVAEECGLIEPLGIWIMTEVCRQVASWHRTFGPTFPTVAVNVSAIQLAQPWLLRRIELALSETGLAPQALEIEITESAFLGKGEVAQQTLHGLREIGVHLAVDDFGTGYSSLSYLRHLPINSLKIDAAFLIGLPSVPQTRAIVRGIIDLSHALGLEVVAEGVEEDAQRAILAELNCDRIQGYLLSPAVSAAEVPLLLAQLEEEVGHAA